MLDTSTKRRIDTCRDILVGKIPDPKSQVEQITIALIYKFMDDMDLESEEMGGRRKFFTGEFERYAWSRLIAPGTSGQDMLNTYSEALTRMPENPGLPTLFRDIFRNAYLPYRDPETLRNFLREINGFIYDHSERLGDAFEYLLSVLGSQGDAGQFRTPRHIIDFMVEIIAPQKNEVILDPACGTAGFLISSYKYILKANTSDTEGRNGNGAEESAAERAIESPLRFKGDLLTPEDRRRLAANIKGYDISPDMVRLSLVNLYLHGFANPQVEEYDTLTSEDKWNEVADVILANPPFMSPKGGIPVHRRFAIQSKRSEVLFVDYIAEHLTPRGRAAVIVPEGIIFQSQTAYYELRKMLIENYLVAVISLPAGVFNPYSGVKTSILILDRSLSKVCDRIAFFKIENDGFNLGAQRRPVKGSQLPQVQAELGAWLAGMRGGGDAALDSTLGHAIEKARIAKAGEYNLSGERYRGSVQRSTNWPMVAIGELYDIARGASPRPIQAFMTTAPEGVNWVKIGDAPVGSKFIRTTKEKVTPEGAQKSRYVKPGDFILSNSMSFGRPYIMATDGCIHDGWLLLRPKKDGIDQDFMYQILGSQPVYNQFVRQATGGVVNNLNSSIVSAVEVPLPPLEVQQEVVAEIEGYQKILDGARAVVETYRPLIPVDPAWPKVELGQMCKLVSGQHIGKEDYNRDGEGIGYLTGPDDFGEMSPIISKWTQKPKVTALFGDILITVKGSGVGKVNLLKENEVAISRQLMAIRVINADPDFVFIWLRGSYDHIQSLGGGAAIPGVTRDDVLTLKVPLPPLEIQEAIVAEIHAEQALVDTNRELIARFERKIDAAIARVWGEAKAT